MQLPQAQSQQVFQMDQSLRAAMNHPIKAHCGFYSVAFDVDGLEDAKTIVSTLMDGGWACSATPNRFSHHYIVIAIFKRT